MTDDPKAVAVKQTATPTNARPAIVALGLMSAGVYLVYLFAGIGPTEARIAVLFMVLLTAGLAIHNAAGLAKWVNQHPLQPER